MVSLFPGRDQFVHLSALVAQPSHWRALSQGDSQWESSITSFISKLRLLEGMPFRYLVPDSNMLPPESIRFFFVDPNWIQTMCDGALSLGRIGEMDQQHDSALGATLVRRSEPRTLNQRRVRLGLRPRSELEFAPLFGGFLMRSAVVSGWPGLEVSASTASEGSGGNTKCTGDPVELIRMDRLAPDVLLCLFAERFACVHIHEPKEGINFGAEPEFAVGRSAALGDDPVRYLKNLRGLGVGGYPAGDFIDGAQVEVPLRAGSRRVVEMANLRTAMVNELEALTPPAWQGGVETFTGAQFSLELVEGAGQHVFRHPDPDPAAGQPTRDQTRRTSLADQQASDEAALNHFLFGNQDEDTP